MKYYLDEELLSSKDISKRLLNQLEVDLETLFIEKQNILLRDYFLSILEYGSDKEAALHLATNLYQIGKAKTKNKYLFDQIGFGRGSSMKHRILLFVGLKECPCCKKLLTEDKFCNSSYAASGLSSICRFCSHYTQIWNPKTREYKRKSDAKRVELRKQYRLDNLIKVKEASKLWRLNNRDYIRFKNSIRRAQLKDACPAWANLELIAEIYAKCEKGFHVDHMIPITNDLVCGLHVDYNLQILPAQENLTKKNKFIQEDWDDYIIGHM